MDRLIKIFDVLEVDTDINMCTDRLKTKDLSEKCKSRGSGACRRYHYSNAPKVVNVKMLLLTTSVESFDILSSIPTSAILSTSCNAVKDLVCVRADAGFGAKEAWRDRGGEAIFSGSVVSTEEI